VHCTQTGLELVVIVVANVLCVNAPVIDGMRLASKRGCKFIEVSAFLDHRVDELLAGVVAQVRLRQLAVGGPPFAVANSALTTAPDRLPLGGGRCHRLRKALGQLWSRWTGRCLNTSSSNANSVTSNCDNLFLL